MKENHQKLTGKQIVQVIILKSQEVKTQSLRQVLLSKKKVDHRNSLSKR